ncbi:MAG TPA: WhiB family transcriptional regulator [Acidimicrobiia bacterium]|jgi:WhiB family transcriptional regulator, redox-sensing transcriptional regulator|nr:WhiB family transcriptional regulator [Acidimicrobiia bacterium]
MRDIYRSGRCNDGNNHHLFFSQRASDLASAQAICARCPVRIQCLEVALEEGLEYGVWGGVIFWDGQAFHRKRGRGRPRRSDTQLPVEADRDELEALVRSA